MMGVLNETVDLNSSDSDSLKSDSSSLQFKSEPSTEKRIKLYGIAIIITLIVIIAVLFFLIHSKNVQQKQTTTSTLKNAIPISTLHNLTNRTKTTNNTTSLNKNKST